MVRNNLNSTQLKELEPKSTILVSSPLCATTTAPRETTPRIVAAILPALML